MIRDDNQVYRSTPDNQNVINHKVITRHVEQLATHRNVNGGRKSDYEHTKSRDNFHTQANDRRKFRQENRLPAAIFILHSKRVLKWLKRNVI